MAKSNEPVWWSLFGAGGVICAFLMPATILAVGFGVPLGWVSPAEVYNGVHHPLGRLYLFLMIAFPLFHAAHRTLFTLVDVGLKSARPLLSILFYGGAIVGTVLAAVFLIRL